MQEKIVGKYKILEEIGRGGMGIVYKGIQISLGRVVAIKMLPAQNALDETYLHRFMREAETLAKLHHHNIVYIFDVEKQEDNHYLIMEYIEGENVAQLLESQGTFSPDEASRIIGDVASALSHAHEKGIIHRDIKPANIMISKDGVVKVTDFGIARVTQGPRETRTGVSIGTPKYMSPEQVRGDSDLDGRSDIYSLGIVFYEMVTGKAPFTGDGEFAILEQQIKEEPPPPFTARSDVSAVYNRIILKCLSKDKAHRYETAEDLITALATISSREDGTQLPLQDGPTLPLEKVTIEKKSRRSVYLLAGLSIVCLFFVLLFAIEPPIIEEKSESKEEPVVTTSIAKAAPSELEVLAATGEELFTTGEYESAREAFLKILALEPDNQPAKEWIQKISIKEFTMRGEELFTSGAYQGAKEAFLKILVLEPDNQPAKQWIEKVDGELSVESLFTSGVAYYNKAHYSKCIRTMDEVLRIKTNHTEARHYIKRAERKIETGNLMRDANSLFEQHQYLPASQLFKKVLSLDTTNHSAQAKIDEIKKRLINLGNWYRNQGELADAERCYLQAREIDSHDPDIESALGGLHSAPPPDDKPSRRRGVTTSYPFRKPGDWY